MTILITGGTGLIGKALTEKLLAEGNAVHILTRDKRKHAPQKRLSYFNWDVNGGKMESSALENVDAIIHLAGANVADKRWTKERKKEIVDSRVNSGQLLVKALKQNKNNVKTFICASAIGWYGENSVGARPFIETDTPAGDFLGQTCVQWEESVDEIKTLGIRVAYLRTGIVLAREGGAYAEFRKPMLLGVAPIMGSGNQIISWIHIDDIVSMYLYALNNKSINGVYNAVAPQPVSNKELVQRMKETKSGFALAIPVPAFVLKTMLGEMSIEILKSATVSAQKIRDAGYAFRYPFIASAVNDLED